MCPMMSEAGQLLARWRTTNQMGLTVCLLRKGGFGPSMGQCSERGFALVGGVFSLFVAFSELRTSL